MQFESGSISGRVVCQVGITGLGITLTAGVILKARCEM